MVISADQKPRGMELVDWLGLLLLACTVVGIAGLLMEVRAPDVLVYHLALAHIGPDDVYLHLYPGPAEPFSYPPSALLILLPLGVSGGAARLLMFSASVASVWITMALTTRAAAPGTQWARPGAIALFSTLMMISLPVFLGMGLGQVAPVVVGLVAVGTLGRRSRWNGVWVGTATAIKLTPAVFAVHWAMVGRWRAATVAAATFVAWTAAAAFLMPESSGWFYLEGGVAKAGQDYANINNQALTGVVERAGFVSPTSRVVALGLSAVLLMVALAVAARLHRAGWTAAAVALVGVWSGIAAPLAWIHAFAWWVPLAVAIALYGRTRRDVLVAAGVYFLPLLQFVGPESPAAFSIFASAGFAALGVLVTAWLWWRVRDVVRPELVVADPTRATHRAT